jgi:mRNA interferase MazF
LKRGDIVTVAAGGGVGGKPRPALVLQPDSIPVPETVIVVLFTTALADAMPLRPRITPDARTGLRQVSDLMADIIVTARRSDVGQVIGHLSSEDLRRAERAVLVMLGFA